MDLRSLLKMESQRKLCLIEALYYSENGLSTEQLLAIMKSSLPVLLSYVKDLNEQGLPFQIIKDKSLYFLKFEDFATIDSIYAHILTTSIEFKMIDQLFIQQHDRFAKIAEAMNCSFSYVQRQMQVLSPLLPAWQIHVRHRPCRLEGNEMMVRQFYYLFFKERRFELKNYNFSEQLIAAVDRYIRAFLLKNNATNSMNTHFYLMHSFLISLHRIKKAHHLHAHISSEHYFKLPHNSEHPELVNRLNLECRVRYTPELIREAMWPIFTDTLVLTPQQQFHQQKTNIRLASFYDLHTNLMDSINLALGMTLTTAEIAEGLRILANDILIYFPDNQVITLLAQPKKFTLQLLRKSYSRAINWLSNIIREFLETSFLSCSRERVELYLSSLIVAIDNLLHRLTQADRLVNVLLISDASPNQEQFWRTTLRNWIHGPMSCSFLDSPYIRQQDLYPATKQYDLIITDITMLKLKSACPVIAVNSYPTPQDIAAIQNFFNNFDASSNSNR